MGRHSPPSPVTWFVTAAVREYSLRLLGLDTRGWACDETDRQKHQLCSCRATRKGTVLDWVGPCGRGGSAHRHSYGSPGLVNHLRRQCPSGGGNGRLHGGRRVGPGISPVRRAHAIADSAQVDRGCRRRARSAQRWSRRGAGYRRAAPCSSTEPRCSVARPSSRSRAIWAGRSCGGPTSSTRKGRRSSRS